MQNPSPVSGFPAAPGNKCFKYLGGTVTKPKENRGEREKTNKTKKGISQQV